MPGMCFLALPSPASCSRRSSCQAGPEGPWAGKEQQETRKALRYFFIMNYITGIVAPLAVGVAVEGVVSGVMGTVQFSKLGFFPSACRISSVLQQLPQEVSHSLCSSALNSLRGCAVWCPVSFSSPLPFLERGTEPVREVGMGGDSKLIPVPGCS